MDVARTTTTQLLRDLLDPAAETVWEEFDGRYRPIIVGFARRLGLADADAADLAQETLTRFVEAYRQGRYDRRRGRLRSWIIGIAKHVVADQRAAGAKQRQWRGNSALDLLADDAELTAIWDAERQAAILALAMDELRAHSRTSGNSIRAFEMVAFEGRSADDAATTLQMTRHDVYVAKHRVTERLRGIVERLETVFDG